MLDANLRHYADVIRRELGQDIADVPGAGAAGGLGAGLMVFLNGKLEKGIELVARLTGLEEKVKMADMVWTGKAASTARPGSAKRPCGVAKVAAKHHKPVIAFAYRIGEGIDGLYEQGIGAVFGILSGACDLQEALRQGEANLERAAENVMRLIMLQRQV